MEKFLTAANDLPEYLGVMPLRDTCLFPASLMFLQIETEEQRKLLDYTLSSKYRFENRFVVALIREQLPNLHPKLYGVGCAAAIRACVENTDGSARLILEGIQRVHLHSLHSRNCGFEIYKIEPIKSVTCSVKQLKTFGRTILKIFNVLKHHGANLPDGFEEYLDQTHDVERLGDIISSEIVSNPCFRQELLEEVSVSVRLKKLIEYLEDLLRKT